MVVNEVKTFAEYKSILASKELVAIDFSATWCGPCKRISPIFEQHSDDPNFQGIYFAKIDVDDNQEASEEAGVAAMPTFMFFRNGVKQFELVGADPTKLLENLKKLSSA